MTVVATAGHVDHGKSALVMALTGTDPDRLDEEKRRGLTIDLGFAHTVLPSGAAVSFVDVPGHVRFIANMLAGVGYVDACVFVVDVNEGWKPQSEEHLRILEVLGVEHGLVALTKTDAVDGRNRSDAEELIELATLDVTEHVAGTFLADAPILPVSAHTGAGIAELETALDSLVSSAPGAVDVGRPRIWVDRVFAARGSGTVVTGTLTGGSVGRDDHVVIEPGGHPARVRAVQTAGASVPSIGPGHRVALNLAGIDRSAVTRGDAVVVPEQWWLAERVDAALTVLSSLDHVVSRRGAFVAYIGSGEHPVRLRVLGRESLAPGGTGSVRMHLQGSLPLLPGDRFVLRESGRGETVGGGEILDVDPVLPASLARPDRRVERVIAERGWVDVDVLERLTGSRMRPTVGQWVAHPAAVAGVADALRADVDAAGGLGLDVASLGDRERAVLATIEGIEIDGGRVRSATATDPLVDHPVVAAMAAGGLAPPDPGADRAVIRELVRRGVLVERDGVCFHADAIATAGSLAARLLSAQPDGFTVAEFREAAGITRKHALPLVNELDARGITRRRDDRRIAGPRLPA